MGALNRNLHLEDRFAESRERWLSLESTTDAVASDGVGAIGPSVSNGWR